jgi:hypothetical protein
MGKLKQKAIDVNDMIENGYDADGISLILGIDLEFIKSVMAPQQTNENVDFYGEFNE